MIQPMFGSLGFPELIFIFVLALLIFGPKKMPELGRTLGKAMAEFRKATTDLKRTINAEMLEQEMREADPRQIVRDSLREAKESLENAVKEDAARAEASQNGETPHSGGPAAVLSATTAASPQEVASSEVAPSEVAPSEVAIVDAAPAEGLPSSSPAPNGPAPAGAVARGAAWDDDEPGVAPPASQPTPIS